MEYYRTADAQCPGSGSMHEARFKVRYQAGTIRHEGRSELGNLLDPRGSRMMPQASNRSSASYNLDLLLSGPQSLSGSIHTLAPRTTSASWHYSRFIRLQNVAFTIKSVVKGTNERTD